MTGVEVAVGFLIAWAVKKANRVGTRADAIVDDVIDRGLDRVHDVVSNKPGEDPALAQLESEAAHTATVSQRTRTRVELALEEAAEQDPQFGQHLHVAVEHARSAGADSVITAVGQRGVVVRRDNSGTISTGDNAINMHQR